MEPDQPNIEYTVAALVVELLRSTPGNEMLNLNERLVANAVNISTQGPHRLTRQKIADVISVDYATAGRALRKLIDLGRVCRLEDYSYVLTPQWRERSYHELEISRKVFAILRAAETLRRSIEKNAGPPNQERALAAISSE
jgi:DNA-binding MarR family transcriptional regulator